MKESVIKKIIGTWKFVSWIYKDQNGETVHYFGKDAKGILMYDESGYMNAQITRGDRSNFAAKSLGEGSSHEIDAAYKSYAAYYGQFYERSPGEMRHIVEGSLFPNWTGHEEIRYAEMPDNDTLILSAPPIKVNWGEIVFYVTWKRVHLSIYELRL